jgi:hypothetical protein
MNVEQRLEIERKIVSMVIDAAFEKGFKVWIDNGGNDDEIIYCGTPEEAKAQIMQTDEEYLHLYKAENDLKIGYGWVWCVYGNDGYDVIADHSTSEVMEEIINPIYDLIEKGQI